ncbi:cellulose biosynthesis cyclic di-GMP-binding regulatory protein BcsB [Lapidilactobacillus luobeiensis]|uniref:cellulose biosynthesis cyclic di-GMP-binding regulatory protein BcsB n=1 Tax=Lapidilactobacillus luobeiensis TaxID=2950371 RepID=UPI0021C47252|nr:cellulose biosynthesis cyclic di-GMP-binding regulatory protein BcsB [Lapidilactobacillus luobeiensis]
MKQKKRMTIGLWLFLLGALLILRPQRTVAAADLTYTQQFQNQTTSLSGQSVSSNMYFIKMDYWRLKKATFNFSFQLSQLADQQISDITVSLNNIKIYSFRPENSTGLQTKEIELPLDLISGSSELRINGQILNRSGQNDYRLAQTPANWLTIYPASNVNFRYTLDEPTSGINSFYDHFIGPDTIANSQSVILTPSDPDDAELSAAVYALSGISRILTTEQATIPIGQLGNKEYDQRPYRLIISRYDQLPAKFRQGISAAEVAKQAVIKTQYSDQQYTLIVTAKRARDLIKASRFVANQELMKQTKASQKIVTQDTQTVTSVLQYQGSFPLTTTGQRVSGPGHQEASFFVSLPSGRTNANGSTIRLNLQYGQNLDFKRSLVTVYINDTPIGSRRLSASKADGQQLTFDLPKSKSLGNSFVVRVVLDLELPESGQEMNNEAAWATVLPGSSANISSQVKKDLMFTNYPSVFLKNNTFNNILVARPKKMTPVYFKTLTNIFNLIGVYAQSNTGTVTFSTKVPSKQIQANQNIIAFGTPKDNAYLRQINSRLFFKFDEKYDHFLSNEKLSIETKYGHQLGTAQLLRSQANEDLGVLAVTGATANAVYLASTQINYQRHIEQYQGDAIAVDQDNMHYNYRFKTKTGAKKTSLVNQISQNVNLIAYLGLALLMIVVIGLTLFFLLRKHGRLTRRQHDES